MDQNAFTAAIVASIANVLSAWALPLAFIAIAFLFRNEVKSAFSRPLRRMKAWGVEAEWEEKAGETAREAVRAAAPGQATEALPPPAGGTLSDRFRTLAQTEPNAAIMAAFAEVEKAIRSTLAAMGYGQTDMTPLRAHITSLEAEGVISEQTAEAMRGLSMLRNLVVHKPHAAETPDRALDYLAMSDTTLYALRQNAAMAQAARLQGDQRASNPTRT